MGDDDRSGPRRDAGGPALPPENWALLAELCTRLTSAATLDELASLLARGLKWIVDFDSGLFVMADGGGRKPRAWDLRAGGAASELEPEAAAWLRRAVEGDKPIFAAAEPPAERLADAPFGDVMAIAVLTLRDGAVPVGLLAFGAREPGVFAPRRRAPLALLAVQLGNQIGKMRADARLADALEELGRARDDLELRVEARTEELALANRALVEELERRERSEAALRDETRERDRLEQELRQAQKMEAIGRLAGGVAHDFNNLLTAINGYSELALSRLDPESRTAHQIAEVRKAGERAAGLTRQLLAFGRRQAFQPKVFDLAALVADMATLLRRLIGENIELVTVAAPNLSPVELDPGQVEQVVMNLVVNARDAIDGGGRIVVAIANADLDDAYVAERVVVEPGPYVVLSVTDTGCGMDANVRDRIFEPFFTTKDVGKGTGLGLSTVYGIVKQARGYVWVYSEPGAGTTFKVYFHAHSGASASVTGAQASQASRGSASGRETILVVEDEAAIRRLARAALEENGYTILEAANGAEALVLMRNTSGTVDLVLTDVVMPQLGGREFAARLQDERGRMRVVYMSGYAAEAVVRNDLLGEGDSFLPKPFTPSQLRDVVRRALDTPLDAASGR